MIVLDASVLIAHLDANDRHHAEARSLLATSGEETLGASAITLGENAPGRLAQLRAEIGLKLPGCCVLLAAQEHAGSVASFDSGLLAAARKLGLTTG